MSTAATAPSGFGIDGVPAIVIVALQEQEDETQGDDEHGEPGEPSPPPGGQVPVGEQQEEEGRQPGREHHPVEWIVQPGHPFRIRERGEMGAAVDVLRDHPTDPAEETQREQDPADRIAWLTRRDERPDHGGPDRQDGVDQVSVGVAMDRRAVRDEERDCDDPARQPDRCEQPRQAAESLVPHLRVGRTHLQAFSLHGEALRKGVDTSMLREARTPFRRRLFYPREHTDWPLPLE